MIYPAIRSTDQIYFYRIWCCIVKCQSNGLSWSRQHHACIIHQTRCIMWTTLGDIFLGLKLAFSHAPKSRVVACAQLLGAVINAHWMAGLHCVQGGTQIKVLFHTDTGCQHRIRWHLLRQRSEFELILMIFKAHPEQNIFIKFLFKRQRDLDLGQSSPHSPFTYLPWHRKLGSTLDCSSSQVSKASCN